MTPQDKMRNGKYDRLCLFVHQMSVEWQIHIHRQRDAKAYNNVIAFLLNWLTESFIRIYISNLKQTVF